MPTAVSITEEENNMPYVTSIERLARKEGQKDGRRQGLKKGREEACHTLRLDILEKYQARWVQPPVLVVEKLEQIQDLKQLVGLPVHLLTAKRREEWLA